MLFVFKTDSRQIFFRRINNSEIRHKIFEI